MILRICLRKLFAILARIPSGSARQHTGGMNAHRNLARVRLLVGQFHGLQSVSSPPGGLLICAFIGCLEVRHYLET